MCAFLIKLVLFRQVDTLSTNSANHDTFLSIVSPMHARFNRVEINLKEHDFFYRETVKGSSAKIYYILDIYIFSLARICKIWF